MFKDHVFNWLKSNQKVFIYASFLFLFCWYLNPIVKESKNRNNCAKVIGARIYDPDANNILRLKKSYKKDYKGWRQTRNFCEFYKSSEDNISIYGDIDAKIRGVIGTQEYRGY